MAASLLVQQRLNLSPVMGMVEQVKHFWLQFLKNVYFVGKEISKDYEYDNRFDTFGGDPPDELSYLEDIDSDYGDSVAEVFRKFPLSLALDLLSYTFEWEYTETKLKLKSDIHTKTRPLKDFFTEKEIRTRDTKEIQFIQSQSGEQND